MRVNLKASLKPGDFVPDFSAKNQDGKTLRLSEFRGKPVLLYFYPKDDTPGCTQEACSLRDADAALKERGLVVLGISAQNEKSHQAFKKKHSLPFDLLVDSDHKISKLLGVKRIPLLGFHWRQSLLIDPEGKLIRFYRSVRPSHHTEQVLEDLGQASAKPRT